MAALAAEGDCPHIEKFFRCLGDEGRSTILNVCLGSANPPAGSNSGSAVCPCCDLLDSAQYVANVAGRRSWVHHHSAQHSMAVEHGRTDVAKAAFVEPFFNGPMPRVGIASASATQMETEDVGLRIMRR